jgi:hypothetical protein
LDVHQALVAAPRRDSGGDVAVMQGQTERGVLPGRWASLHRPKYGSPRRAVCGTALPLSSVPARRVQCQVYRIPICPVCFDARVYR